VPEAQPGKQKFWGLDQAVYESDSAALPLASKIVNQPAKQPGRDSFLKFVRQCVRNFWQHRFFWRFVALVPFVLLLLVGLAWVDKHPLREVIFQSGFVHLDPQMLQPKIADLLEGNVLEIDLGSIKKRLQTVPWVDRVSIRRVWPDRIKIHLTEKKVLARWKDDGFVSEQGVIFHAPITESAQALLSVLPILSGKESDASQLLNYYEKMSAALAPSGLLVVALRQLERGWHLQLDNEIAVFLSDEHAMTQLSRFRQVYEQLGDRRSEVLSADLRYHHGVAIRWKNSNS